METGYPRTDDEILADLVEEYPAAMKDFLQDFSERRGLYPSSTEKLLREALYAWILSDQDPAPSEGPRRCLSLTTDRTRCGSWADGGSPYCHRHLSVRLRDSYELALESGLSEGRRRGWESATARACADIYGPYEGDPRGPGVKTYVARQGDFVKIGRSTRLKARLTSLSKGGCKRPPGLKPGPVTLVGLFEGDLEYRLHHQWQGFRVGQTEWFEVEGALALWLSELTPPPPLVL